ncbi:hypothetical protein [uncultured Nitrospira sp.]
MTGHLNGQNCVRIVLLVDGLQGMAEIGGQAGQAPQAGLGIQLIWSIS